MEGTHKGVVCREQPHKGVVCRAAHENRPGTRVINIPAQAVGSKTMVREWKLTGSVDATMRRTSREYSQCSKY